MARFEATCPHWDARTEAMIIIEGLKGKPMAEICTEQEN